MRRAAAALAFGLVLASGAAPAHADAELEAKIAKEFNGMLMDNYGTDAKIDAAVARVYGSSLSPEKAKVARENLWAMMFHPQLPSYMARSLAHLYEAPGVSKQDIAAATRQTLYSLKMKGLLRLNAEHQAQALRHSVAMARWLPVAQCKALLLDQLQPAQSSRLERQFTEQLPLTEFEAVGAMYRDATTAELVGYPEVRSINEDQAAVALKVYGTAIAKRLQESLPEDVIARVTADSATAPAGEVCSFLTTAMLALLDMPEPFRSWQLIRFMEAMQ